MRFHCTTCGAPAGKASHAFCACGGMIDVEYDLAHVRLADSENPYVRFGDLLPITETRDRLPRAARYSPTIHAKTLGARIGLPSLYLKDETVLPTRSTKDRMAAVGWATCGSAVCVRSARRPRATARPPTRTPSARFPT
jgi:threonine synthase